jgi:hypothetical protein
LKKNGFTNIEFSFFYSIFIIRNLNFIDKSIKNYTKLKNILQILVWIFLVGLKLQAQQINNMSEGTSGTMSTIRFFNLSEKKYDVLSGSPYTNNSFLAGEILPWKGPWQKGYLLRLNTYSQQLEIIENEQIKAATAELVKGFKIDNSIYLTGFQPIDKNTSTTFYELLFEGKLKLLKYVSTAFEEVKTADDVKQGNQFTTYSYYYICEKEKLTKFLLGKKSFLKAIPEKYSSKVEKFIDDKKLKMKEVADYIEVVKYYESII